MAFQEYQNKEMLDVIIRLKVLKLTAKRGRLKGGIT